MKHANKSLFVSVAALLLWSGLVQAFPIYLKIVNPRDHSVYVESDRENIQIEIKAHSSRFFVITGKSGWRVKYSTGYSYYGGSYLTPSLDVELISFVEQQGQICGAGWSSTEYKYCILQVNYDKPKGYVLQMTEIRDLKIDKPLYELTLNEQKLELVPLSIQYPLIGDELLSKAVVLFSNVL